MPLEPIEFDQIDCRGPASIFTAPGAGVGVEVEHKCLGIIHACNEAEGFAAEGQQVSGHLIDPKHLTELRRHFQD